MLSYLRTRPYSCLAALAADWLLIFSTRRKRELGRGFSSVLFFCESDTTIGASFDYRGVFRHHGIVSFFVEAVFSVPERPSLDKNTLHLAASPFAENSIQLSIVVALTQSISWRLGGGHCYDCKAFGSVVAAHDARVQSTIPFVTVLWRGAPFWA